MNETDLVTAISILVQQAGQLCQLMSQLQSQSFEMQQLVSKENSIAAINPQVHAITASASVVMTAINSQDVLVQQAIDKVAELSV